MRTPLYLSRPCGPAAARFDSGRRVNDFIVMSEACSNSYLIETEQGSILVNTGMGFEAPVIHKNFENLSAQANNIRYIITTQGHVDHVGGVQYFRERNPELKYIAQAGNEEHQQYDALLQPFRARRSAFRFMDSFMDDFAYYSEQGYSKHNPQDRPTADISFEQRYEMELGGLHLVLLGVKGAETNDSLLVFLPQHKILLSGNIFGCPFGHFPNLSTIRGDRYRDALVCAEAAQTVLDLKPELILYGHHAPVEGSALIKEEVTAIRDALHYVHDEVVKGMNAGKALHTLMQEISLPERCKVGEGYGKVSWGVRAIWESYAGWFHHESTTELYAVPRSSVANDLVELAGVEAVVERAKEKLAEDACEQALHLLDVVLAAEPDCQLAIELAIDVHERLLEKPEAANNFWLEGWLLNQIKLLKGGKTKALAFE